MIPAAQQEMLSTARQLHERVIVLMQFFEALAHGMEAAGLRREDTEPWSIFAGRSKREKREEL